MNVAIGSHTSRGLCLTPVLFFFYRLFLFLTLLVSGVASASEADNDAMLETGRRIYEDGVLPDGSPLVAIRPEGFTMEGRYAACVTCHRRSGMGSVEGNVENTVLVPPVAGIVLFAPSRFVKVGLDEAHHYVPNKAWRRALTRTAYDGQSLARSLREGVDPDGIALVAPMPRYNLDDKAMAALTAYLQQLSRHASPGDMPDSLQLATVITPDARPEHTTAVIGVLREWSSYAKSAGKTWQLHEWQLSGKADTWQAQLEALYRRQPVFALLSGVGGTNWLPVHQFCESRRIACVLPSVEVAPDAGDDWYSMYFSPGISLEARILGSYLDENQSSQQDVRRIIQVYSDTSSRHAAETLKNNSSASDIAISNRRFRITSPLSALKNVTGKDDLVLWLRADEIAQLVDELPEGPEVQRVFLSALLAAPEEISLPPAWKQRTYFVSLFDDLGLQAEIARHRLDRWFEQQGLSNKGSRRLQADAYAACYLFDEALGDIRQQEIRRPEVPLTREHLLEVLEKLVNKYDDSTGLVNIDSHVAWYGRMSLGPNQRVAVRGGSILHYASPDAGKLTAASKRIVP